MNLFLQVGFGAELNGEDGDGYTPVMVALWFQRVEVLRELLALPRVALEVPGGGSIHHLAG